MIFNNKKKGKGNSEIIGGRLVKREVRGYEQLKIGGNVRTRREGWVVKCKRTDKTKFPVKR